MSRTLDGDGELTLMSCAGAGGAARNDLCALGKISAKTGNVLVVYVFDLVYAESANLLAGFASAAIVVAIESIVLLHNENLLFQL